MNISQYNAVHHDLDYITRILTKLNNQYNDIVLENDLNKFEKFLSLAKSASSISYLNEDLVVYYLILEIFNNQQYLFQYNLDGMKKLKKEKSLINSGSLMFHSRAS